MVLASQGLVQFKHTLQNQGSRHQRESSPQEVLDWLEVWLVVFVALFGFSNKSSIQRQLFAV